MSPGSLSHGAREGRVLRQPLDRLAERLRAALDHKPAA